MIAGLLDHIWQSTLFAGGIALLTLFFRRNRAALRFWLWFAASVKFLVPFAALAALGEYLSHRLPAAMPPSILAIQPAAEKLSAPARMLVASHTHSVDLAQGIGLLADRRLAGRLCRDTLPAPAALGAPAQVDRHGAGSASGFASEFICAGAGSYKGVILADGTGTGGDIQARGDAARRLDGVSVRP